jgi:hypothetical protein
MFREKSVSISPDPASRSLVLAGKEPLLPIAPFVPFHQPLSPSSIVFPKQLTLGHQSSQVSDVPISFPVTERKLRSVVVQTTSPQVLIDQSWRSSSHPCRCVHCRLEIERLFVIDELVIKAPKMRTTKTHNDIPAL